MKLLAGAALLLFSVLGVARASSYEDFNVGINAHNRSDSRTAIAAFGRALAAGDLAPSLHSVALLDRGIAYSQLKEYDDAIADFDALIKYDPANYDARNSRANTYVEMEDFTAALPDCEFLNSLRPGSARLLGWCGRIAFMGGRFDVAAGYFERAIQLGENDPWEKYDWLWLTLSALRSGKAETDSILAVGRRFDRSSWPGPIISFFLGSESIGNVQERAISGEKQVQDDQQCEAGFYIGEWEIAYHNRTDAKALLQDATKLCPDHFFEYQPAHVELKRLD